MLANHDENSFMIRGNLVEVKRGFIGCSEDTLAKKWKWSRGKVRRFLKHLETVQQIVHHKSSVLSLIEVKNYNTFQVNDTKNGTTDSTTERQQTVQQTDTNKKDKNVKNEKNIPTEYGRADINEVILFLKKTMNIPALDGSEKQNRFAAKRLIDKLSKIKDHESAMANIKAAIQIASIDSFWKTKVTSVRALEQHIITILKSGAETIQKNIVHRI